MVCLLLLWVSPALSQEPNAQLKTSVDATTITVGDVVTVKLSVKHPESLKIAFPPVGATLGEWIVRSSNRLPVKPADGIVEDVLELQLAVYKTGEFEIPALSDRNGQDQWRKVDPCFRTDQNQGPVSLTGKRGHAQRPEAAS